MHMAASFQMLKTSSSLEEYERACCIRGCHEYEVLTVLLAWPLSTTAFFTALFARAITCVGRHVDNDPSGSGRPPFGFKLTSRMRTSSVPSQEQSIQNSKSHVLFSYRRLTLQNFFMSLIMTNSYLNYSCTTLQPSQLPLLHAVSSSWRQLWDMALLIFIVGWTNENILTTNVSQFVVFQKTWGVQIPQIRKISR